ncbi:unnamed protein product [Paramecium primaurelia]|uniref:Uncharacterized protein n=1 Tax=Paramecium primaurelia TaxID=5886 RepID=A0A8S1QU05_PARPR|nr:unnamed protein product [Paramecium primaurelia]
MEQIQFLQWQGEYGKTKKKQGKWIATWKEEIIQEVGGYYTMIMDQKQVNGNNQVRVIEVKLKCMKAENTFLIKNQGDGITSMITKRLEVGHMFKQLDKSIIVCGVKIGQIILKMDDHSDIVQSVCFSPNGTLLAFASANQSILLWDIKMVQQNILSVFQSPLENSYQSQSIVSAIIYLIKRGLHFEKQ